MKQANKLFKYKKRFTQVGASLVEMALLISLIALVGMASVGEVGKAVKCSYYSSSEGFTGAPAIPFSEASGCCPQGFQCDANTGNCTCDSGAMMF